MRWTLSAGFLSAILLLAACEAPGHGGGKPRTPPRPPVGVALAAAPADAGTAPQVEEIAGETVPEGEAIPPLMNDDTPGSDEPNESEQAKAAKGSTARCSLEDKHLAATEDAILGGAARPDAHPVALTRWDHRTPPARLALVDGRFGLTAAERSLLQVRGFVVPTRLAFTSYSLAYHELYQSELPLFVSVDSILHTVFAAEEEIVEDVEGHLLRPLLDGTLRRLHEGLPAAAPSYPPEVAADLDLYLTVARTLLAGAKVRGPCPGGLPCRGPCPGGLPCRGPEDTDPIVAAAMKADALEEIHIFGRPRMVDFSQYKPRGHYAKSRALARYFRAAMWLSRLEFNLVSRSCRSSQPGIARDPSETPREATLALALADLAERTGAMPDIGLLDEAWGAFAGVREDVPLARLAELRRTAGIGALTAPDVADRLRAAIGDRFQRTARLHYMPQGSTVLPAIATLLGPRVVPDAAATRPLVHAETPNRYDLGVADLAFAFGHDRAERYLAADEATFPGLATALRKSRAIVAAPSPVAGSGAGKDLYGGWLAAVRALADRPPGVLPSYMETDAFQDLRLASFVSAYGQIKHTFVLMAGQPYDEGACAVPDGFVEPAPAVYAALAAYAGRGQAAMALLDPKGVLGSAAYFARLGKLMRVLGAISDAELAGLPLSPDALAFLSMVVEIHSEDIGTGWSTTYNGWYFDLFLSRPAQTTYPFPGRDDSSAMKAASFIADYYTSVNSGNVAYAGASLPRLGIFVVDTGGAPRVVVGPVAHAYEHHAALGARLTDAEASKLTTLTEPWAESYAVPAPPEPPLWVEAHLASGDKPFDERAQRRSSPVEVRVRSLRRLGPVTIELRDHHRRITASLTRDAGPKEITFAFPSHPQSVEAGTHATEMIGIRMGDFHAWMDILTGGGSLGLGGMAAPP
jgi:hypothetical protein